jgi:hypothetical protein
LSARPAASLIVAGLAAALMFGPAIVALPLIFAGHSDGPGLQPIVTLNLAPVLESGRILLTLALATKVMRTTELQ